MKKNYTKNILGGKYLVSMIVSICCLMIISYWYSFTGDSEFGEAQNSPSIEKASDAANKNNKNKKAEKQRGKKYINFTSKTEMENTVIMNPDTPHEHKVYSKRGEGEKYPDLSSSTIYPVVSSTVKPGEEVQYIVVLENKGNTSASGFDVMVEIDGKYSEVKQITFSGCDNKKKYNIENNIIGISNINVKKSKACQIQFKAIPDTQGNLINNLYISVAAEGGEEIGPIKSAAVTVRGDEILPPAEPVLEPIAEANPTPKGEIDQSRAEEPVENPEL